MNNDGEVRIGTILDNSGFEKGAKDLKKEAENVDKEVSNILNKSSQSTKGLGNALGGVAKKAVCLGSALFNVVAVGAGIGAVGLGAFILGKALDKANGKTEQLKANLSYIGFVASKIFENLLQPAIDKTTNAVNGLVGALYKAVVYIGYILSKWTGKDLFKGTSVSDYAKSMEKANKSAKKTAKSTKQIKKDLMGFDEVNKLSENVSSSSGGGVSTPKITTPTLPNISEITIPKWVQWIADNKDTILKVTGAILGLLTFSKVVKWLSPLANFFSLFSGGKLAGNISGILGPLGQVLAIVGSIVTIAYSIGEYAEQRNALHKDLNRLYDNGLKTAKEDAKTVKNIKDTQEVLNNKTKQGNKLLKESHNVDNQIMGTTKQTLKQAEGVAYQNAEYLKTQFQLYKQGKLNNEDQEKLIKLIRDQKKYVYEVYDWLEAEGMSTDNLNSLTDEYNKMLSDMGYKAKSFYDILVEKSSKAEEKTKNIKDYTKVIPDNIAKGTNELDKFNKKKLDDKTAKINLEANTSKANRTLSDFIKGIGTKLSDAFKKIDLSGLGKKITDGLKKLIPDIKLPTLSSIKKIFAREGGIINVPGRGVQVGQSIIGGEAGPEALLPLDDKTMDRLGSAIARHMVINTTNINQINGRTLSREVKQIMSENDFASNI